jgi:hypothetical protein
MKIKVLSSAIEDLYEGRLFYEKQGEGLGDYFFDSLFSDIDSLVLYGGIHIKVFVTIVCCPRDFLTPSTIGLKRNHELWFTESLIYVVIPRRSNSH